MLYSSHLNRFFCGVILLILCNCSSSNIDRLMPETQQFLMQQESARCQCLDQHGAIFDKNLRKGINYLKKLPLEHPLDSLTLSAFHAIKLGIVDATSIIKIMTECVQTKFTQPDQLTAMLIQEDLRVVLGIDSSMTDQQKFARMNQPGLEIMRSICPEHLEKMNNFYAFIKHSTILPKALQ